jgi:hypothetical protein
MLPTAVRHATAAQSRDAVHLFEDADWFGRTTAASDEFGQEHATFVREPLPEATTSRALKRSAVRALPLDDGNLLAAATAWPFELHFEAVDQSCRSRRRDGK